MLENAGIELNASLTMVHAFIHILIDTLLLKEQSGEVSKPAIRVFIHSACEFTLKESKTYAYYFEFPHIF